MEKSSFFNAHLENGVYDRTYQAEDFAKYFSTFIGNGVFPNPSTNCQVTANDNMTIKLQPGLAWINGYLYQNTDELQLTVDPADGVLNRQDRVVLRLDFINREIKAYVLKGEYTSSGTPHAPNLTRTADIYELGLAQIDVMAGVTKITQSAINDVRWQVHQCGIVSGTVQTVDITTLYNQYKTKFEEDESNFATKANSTYADFNKKLNDSYLEFTNNFNTWFDDNTTEWSDEFTSWFDGIKKKLSGDIATSLQNQIDILNESVKNHNHDSVYVKQDGSTAITGPLQLNQGSYVLQTTRVDGIYAFVAEIKIWSTYQNRPIKFEIVTRGHKSDCTCYIQFKNHWTNDPDIESFSYISASNDYSLYLVKTATSTWDLYIKKTEDYDSIDITDFSNMNTNTAIIWKNEGASTLPEGGIYATPLQHTIADVTGLQSALDSKAPEKYILQFEGPISSDFRKKIIGTTDVCGFVKSFRKNDSSDACMPPYGAGLAWGQVATHGMLYADINNPVAYISAGNQNKLNWYKQIAWKDDFTKYLPLSGGTMTGDINLPKGTRINTTSQGGYTLLEETDASVNIGFVTKAVNLTGSAGYVNGSKILTADNNMLYMKNIFNILFERNNGTINKNINTCFERGTFTAPEAGQYLVMCSGYRLSNSTMYIACVVSGTSGNQNELYATTGSSGFTLITLSAKQTLSIYECPAGNINNTCISSMSYVNMLIARIK